MAKPSPICLVNSLSTTNGVDVTANVISTISLASRTGVDVWQISCIGTDETTSAPAITAALSVDYTLKRCTFTAPDVGKAMIFRSMVNGNLLDGIYNKSLSTTFGIYTLINGSRVMAVNEQLEPHAVAGWVSTINAFIRSI